MSKSCPRPPAYNSKPMIDVTFTYGDLEYFLLILVRVSAFVFVAPFFSARGIPARYKVAFSLFIAIVLYDVAPRAGLNYSTVYGYAFIVIKEVLTGAILAFAALICMQIGSFAGQIIDMMTGLSMVSIMDPATNTNVTITGALYQQMLMIMLIISGMYRYLIKALADSFTIIPVNGAVFQMHFLLRTMLEFMKDYMVIGFRITLPVFIVSFTMNIVLGILAKVSPQLNMFAVGMQLKILVGLGILFLTSSMLSIASDFVFDQMKILIQEFAYGLTP